MKVLLFIKTERGKSNDKKIENDNEENIIMRGQCYDADQWSGNKYICSYRNDKFKNI